MPSGITTYSSPNTLQPIPCYNEHWFVSSSTNYLAANFKYTIILTDLLSGYTEKHEVPAKPNGKLEFNAQFFAEKNMTNYIPINQYGWKKCTGAIRKIRVNIGETHGTTPTYTAGSNIDYNTFNGALDLIDFANYNVSAYCYDDTIPVYPYLSGSGIYKAYVDRSDYLYVLAQAIANQLTYLEIFTYNSVGTILGVYQIARPSSATGLYTDNYQCIDIGYKGLLNIPSLQVTVISGSYPIITNSVASYKVFNGNTGALIRDVTIDCNPKFTTYTLHYLNRKGGYDTLHCSLASIFTSEKQTFTSKKNGWTNVSNVMTFDSNQPLEKINSVILTDKVKVTSDWLTDIEIEWHKDLFSSPLVYIDLGSSSNYIPIKVSNTSYVTRNSDLLRQLTFDLTYTHDNHRQRG